MEKIKRGFSLSVMLCLLQWGASSTAHANLWSSNWCNACGFQDYLDLDIGYRWDKFAVDATDWSVSGNRIDNVQLDTRHVSSLQVGLSGLWSPFCTGLYVRGEGHYSKVLNHDGLYDEFTPILSSGETPRRLSFKGRIRGHAWDVNAAIGYLIDINCCWGVAPVLGWSYDKLHWRIRHVRDQFGTRYASHNLHNRFTGPFVGVDSLFCLNPCTRIKLGYELHWAMWKLQEHAETLFNQRMRSNNVWGNVFRAEGTYTFCGCWNLGMELKYQIWRSVGLDNEWNMTDLRNGGTANDRSTSLPLIEEHIAYNLSWNSFSARLKIGTSF